MLLFTHIFNLVAFLLPMTAVLFLDLLYVTSIRNHGLRFSVMLLSMLATIALIVWFFVPIANWLFLAVFRGTIVSFTQAKEFSPLFLMNKKQRWYPVRELRNIPKVERVSYLRHLLARARVEEAIEKPSIALR